MLSERTALVFSVLSLGLYDKAAWCSGFFFPVDVGLMVQGSGTQGLYTYELGRIVMVHEQILLERSHPTVALVEDACFTSLNDRRKSLQDHSNSSRSSSSKKSWQ